MRNACCTFEILLNENFYIFLIFSLLVMGISLDIFPQFLISFRFQFNIFYYRWDGTHFRYSLPELLTFMAIHSIAQKKRGAERKKEKKKPIREMLFCCSLLFRVILPMHTKNLSLLNVLRVSTRNDGSGIAENESEKKVKTKEYCIEIIQFSSEFHFYLWCVSRNSSGGCISNIRCFRFTSFFFSPHFVSLSSFLLLPFHVESCCFYCSSDQLCISNMPDFEIVIFGSFSFFPCTISSTFCVPLSEQNVHWPSVLLYLSFFFVSFFHFQLILFPSATSSCRMF